MKRFLLIFMCVLSLFTGYTVASDSDLSVSASSAIGINASTYETVYEKNSTVRMPMASTTKIMTCLIALENGNCNDTVTVPACASGIEGTSLYLKEGDSLTLSDMLYGMMLQSANDAATAIAYHIGGDVDSFVNLMNRKAAELGLTNTSFKNPSGLPDVGHYTTAYDFALLTCHALNNEKFREIVSTKSKDITVNTNEDTVTKTVVNHNRFLSMYDGCIGVKTGFTKASGRCLVTACEREGATFVAVTLNAPDDWADHKKIMDYCFSSYCDG